MRHLALIDLTKANAGTEGYLLDRARRFFSDVSKEDFWFLCLVDQRSYLPGEPHVSVTNDRQPSAVAVAVGNVLDEIARSTSVDLITIVTFHGAVFDLRANLPNELNGRIQVKPFKALLGLQTAVSSLAPRSAQHPLRSWPADFLNRNVALDALVEALRRLDASPAKPARHSDLRIVLSHISEKFNRESSPATPPGLIAQLVREGVAEGLVGTRALPNDSANPYVWAVAAKERPQIDTATQPDEAGKHPRQQSTQTRSGSKTRSDEFIAILTSLDLGPFANVRERFFDELQREVESGGTVASVVNGAYHRVKEQVDRENQALPRRKPFPWRHARRFFENLLRVRPILVAETGAMLTPSMTQMFERVSKLEDNWRTRLNAEIILGLLQSGVVLSFSDLESLTGALFARRNRANRQRVEELIDYLKRSGQVSTNDDSMSILQSSIEPLPDIVPMLEHALPLAAAATLVETEPSLDILHLSADT